MIAVTGMPEHNVCERARLARDARFDGRFFTAVKTTRIYCRPICPAPSPRAANVTYFATAAAAAEAGFRPCLRCRPEAAPGTPAWAGTSTTVARGLKLIAEGALDDGGVEQLAARLGVTSRHLSRLFREHVGASPVAIAQTRRLQFAKRLIDETSLSFADIALAAGYRSLRRFNHTLRETWQRSPRELRKLRAGRSGGDELVLEIALRTPFDADHWLAFLARRAIPGVETVTDGEYSRVHSADAFVRIRPLADRARVTLVNVPAAELFEVMRRARNLLDADADPHAIARSLRGDPVLNPLVKRRPGVRLPGAWEFFELAVRAVLGQQISVAAARTFAARVVARWGSELAVPLAAGMTHVFPDVTALRSADFREIGLPAKRGATLNALAAAVADGNIDTSSAPEELCNALQELPGIGPWTAQYIAMRALRDPDALPSGDLVLRRMLGGSQPLSMHAVERRAESWRPWRAYGLMHLWQAATDEQEKRK